jgi:hypothetical protein
MLCACPLKISLKKEKPKKVIFSLSYLQLQPTFCQIVIQTFFLLKRISKIYFFRLPFRSWYSDNYNQKTFLCFIFNFKTEPKNFADEGLKNYLQHL